MVRDSTAKGVERILAIQIARAKEGPVRVEAEAVAAWIKQAVANNRRVEGLAIAGRAIAHREQRGGCRRIARAVAPEAHDRGVGRRSEDRQRLHGDRARLRISYHKALNTDFIAEQRRGRQAIVGRIRIAYIDRDLVGVEDPLERGLVATAQAQRGKAA